MAVIQPNDHIELKGSHDVDKSHQKTRETLYYRAAVKWDLEN